MLLRRPRVVLLLAACLSLLVGAAVPVHADDVTPTTDPAAGAPADPAPVSNDPMSILGPSRLDAAGLVAVYERTGHHPRLTVPLPELAQIFIEEGQRYGVRSDMAWAQSLLETAWFTYPDYGQVHPQDNNYSGIGAYDNSATGFGYPDARSGVRAQMQLLRQYADPAGANAIHDPILVRAPKSKWGIAPTWMQMGNGNWATSPTYAAKVTSIYMQMLGVADATQVAQVAPDPGPRMRPGDGLWLAGLDGQVYDVGDARFWGSAAGTVDTTTVAGIAITRTRLGYWVATTNGHVKAYGDADQWGDPQGMVAPVTDIATAPNGSGYWVVSEIGEVQSFGAAQSMTAPPGAFPPGDRVVAAAPTPAGDGLWLVDETGRVVPLGAAKSFGDAQGSIAVDDPVVDIAVRPQGDGYWLLTRSGRVLHFGDAPGYGSLSDEPDGAIVPGNDATVSPPQAVGIESTLTGEGYWIVRSDGRVAGRGDAVDFTDVPLHGAPLTAATSWAESGT